MHLTLENSYAFFPQLLKVVAWPQDAFLIVRLIILQGRLGDSLKHRRILTSVFDQKSQGASHFSNIS